MKTSTNFNYLSTSVKELLPKSRNFISYSFKTIWLLLIAVVFFAATSCEEEEASTNNCDAQIDNLTTILTTKSNAFATNSSVTSCQEFRSAYLNLFNNIID